MNNKYVKIKQSAYYIFIKKASNSIVVFISVNKKCRLLQNLLCLEDIVSLLY